MPGEACRRCAATGLTCCQPAYGVTVTFHDARRLLALTGLPPREVLQLKRIRSPLLLGGLKVDPWFRMLFIGPDRLLQVRQRGADCRFLGAGGCTILPDRPRLCRLHPFWFGLDDDGALRIQWDGIDSPEEAQVDRCLVVSELYPSIGTGLKSIGETPWTFLAEARTMMEELDWHRRAAARLARGRDAGTLRLADLGETLARVPVGGMPV